MADQKSVDVRIGRWAFTSNSWWAELGCGFLALVAFLLFCLGLFAVFVAFMRAIL